VRSEEQAREGLAKLEVADKAEALCRLQLSAKRANMDILGIIVLPLPEANILEIAVLPMLATKPAETLSRATLDRRLPHRQAPHPYIGALGVKRESETPGAD